MTDDLRQFREEWRKEVQSRQDEGVGEAGSSRAGKSKEQDEAEERHTLSKSRLEIVEATKAEFGRTELKQSKSALDDYEDAVEKERSGFLSEALILYRQAFKKDDGVDHLYRQRYFPPQQSSRSRGEENGMTARATEAAIRFPLQVSSHGHNDDTVESLSKLLDRLEIACEVEEQPSPICRVPEEILEVMLMHSAVYYDMRAFINFTFTCKKLYVLGHSSRLIWRSVCIPAYREMAYSQPPEESDVVQEWHGKWRTMYIERPRIRFHGVYISSCWYCRPGAADSWNTPIHMVTYYRYIRFYPDGTCLTLLSNTAPAEIVPVFFPWSSKPRLSRGTWKMTLDGHLSIESEAPVAKYKFKLELQIKSTSRGRHNKFVWENFASVNIYTDDVFDFSLRTEKSFFFSPVRSYGKQIYPSSG